VNARANDDGTGGSGLPGLSRDALPGHPPLRDLPLTVLVGVTGVGKSTALAALGDVRVLPDRREVTDAVMIAALAGRPVTDREERFALTARYRETHPGGMAQALGSLHADPAVWPLPLVFDGLRGQDEVQYAAAHFPAWRFVSLHAPDPLRVRRLLGRADRFDRVSATGPDGTPDLRSALALLNGVRDVFTPAELDALAALTDEGHAPDDVLAKTRIVVSERRNYDPQAARAVLAALPADRQIDLDTSVLGPDEVAARVRAWTAQR